MSQGKIKNWNNEKGFGFIQSNDYPQDIFCHISAVKNLPKGINPVVDDIVTIQVKSTKKGLQAVQAVYPNANNYTAEPIQAKPRPRNNSQTRHYQDDTSSFSFMPLIIIACLLVVGYYFYQNFWNNDISETNIDTNINALSHLEQTTNGSQVETNIEQNFTCDGREHCSQMNSYEEAKYFLDHCPNTKMDGDGDGIPCERQFNR